MWNNHGFRQFKWIHHESDKKDNPGTNCAFSERYEVSEKLKKDSKKSK